MSDNRRFPPAVDLFGIEPEDYETWVPSRDAIAKIAAECVAPSVESAVIEYLKGAVIRAASNHVTNEYYSGGSTISVIPEVIQFNYWGHIATEKLATLGSAEFSVKNPVAFNEDMVVRCFGIRFEPSGLARLIADLPKRPEKFDDWLTPREAVDLIAGSYSSRLVAQHAIHERLKGSVIKAHAQSSAEGEYGGHRTIPLMVPNRHWGFLTGAFQRRFWETGDATILIDSDPTRLKTVRYYGIRFEPDGVRSLAPTGALKTTQESSPAPLPSDAHPQPVKQSVYVNKGGAPRKEFWDDLYIAIFEKFWLENFTPRNQEEVARAMLDWAATKEVELGETSVKIPARKMWALFRKGEGSKT
jgi:hypothetical protein